MTCKGKAIAAFAALTTALMGVPAFAAVDNMTYLDHIRPIPGLSHQLDIVVEGPYAYSVGVGGFTLVDITDPVNMVVTDNYNPGGHFTNVAVDAANALAYCSARERGLWVISTSNPNNLVKVFDDSYPAFIEGIALGDQVLYGAAHNDGLYIFDLTSPTSPALSNIVTSGIEDAWRLVVKDDYLLVADGNGGIKVLDLTDPLDPFVVQDVPTSGDAKELAVVGDRLLVAAGSGGMDILDITDPPNASLLGTYESVNPIFDVSGHGGVAAAATWNLVEMVDISDATQPVMAGWEDTPERAMSAFVAPSYEPGPAGAGGLLPGTVVYVADWTDIRSYEYGPPYDADIQGFPELIEMAPLPLGTVVDSLFTVINTGGVTVNVTNIQKTGSHPGAFQVQSAVPFSILPGDSSDILVRFTSPGGNSATVAFRVFSNDPDENPVRLEWNMLDSDLDIGDPAPDFFLMDLDGLPHGLSDHLGEVVLLAFFTTW